LQGVNPRSGPWSQLPICVRGKKKTRPKFFLGTNPFGKRLAANHNGGRFVDSRAAFFWGDGHPRPPQRVGAYRSCFYKREKTFPPRGCRRGDVQRLFRPLAASKGVSAAKPTVLLTIPRKKAGPPLSGGPGRFLWNQVGGGPGPKKNKGFSREQGTAGPTRILAPAPETSGGRLYFTVTGGRMARPLWIPDGVIDYIL